MFVLHVRLPDKSEREVALPRGELLLLGRGNAATLRLDDPAMSRVHCRLLAKGGRVILTDAGSRWGTLVNDEPVTETEVRPGDEITIGETVVTLKTRGRPEATTVAPPVERVVKQRRAAGMEPDEHFDTATESAFDSALVAEAVFDSNPPASVEVDDSSTTNYVEQFSAEFFSGIRFARYDVKELVANARTGLVFRAHDSEADRDVALKLFRPEVLESQSDRQRFLRGIRTMLPLKHENLVELYAAGRFRGICYTACEFIDGESAAGMIQRIGVGGMLDPAHVLRIGMHIARALEFAADHRIVHRNLTPQNILIRNPDRTAKLGDLMFAKALDGTSAERITRAGELVGEIPWMSPEIAGSGEPVDSRSDLYSLGAVLYALLTGKPPFEGRSPAATLELILDKPPEKPAKKQLSIPPLFEGVLLHLLEKRPADRPGSARLLVRDLERVAKYEDIRLD
jgi:hypothetical protein